MRQRIVPLLAAVVLGSLIVGLAQTRLPEGPGRALVEQRCQACHGLEPILGKRLSESDWNGLVGRMISYGAQVSPEERRTVVAYLAANFAPAGAAPAAPAAPAAAATADEGAQVFQARCAGCHQAAGTGVPGAFPPLARHVPALLRAGGGRDYLPLVLLFGLQGPIQAGGQAYNGAMPGFASLSDAQLAGVLNHISTQWDNAGALPAGHRPYTPQEVAALRARNLSPAQVLAERAKLNLP